MKVAARAVTAAMTRPTGLASITAFIAAIPVRTSLMAETILGASVMTVPTPTAIFPMTMRSGPTAAAMPIKVRISLCVAGFMFMMAFMIEMPCNLSAFILGFVLREYTDGSYSWSDGLSNDELTVNRLKEMVDEVIKLQNTPNKKYKDKYIVALTEEEKSFKNAATVDYIFRRIITGFTYQLVLHP